MIQTNTPADIIANFLELQGLAGGTTGYALVTGFRSDQRNIVCCSDTGVRYDGHVHRTKERLKAPKVQVLIRGFDYKDAAKLADKMDVALSKVTVADKIISVMPERTVMISAFMIYMGPSYVGRDPKPGQLENFSLNGILTLTTVSIP